MSYRQPHAAGRAQQPRRSRVHWWPALAALVAVLALGPALSLPAAPPLTSADAPLAVPGEALITLVPEASEARTPLDLPVSLHPLLARYAIHEVKRLGSTQTYRLRGALADPLDLSAAFAAEPAVVAAEPNWLVHLANDVPDDPLYRDGDQWHLARIDAPGAWAITTGDPSILVAIVDSGLDPTHPDLAGRVVGGYDFVLETPTLTDPVGHGTTVASFITARTNDGRGLTGLAPDVRLMGFRALGLSGGASFDTARGIIAAADAGARVINCSFGGAGTSRALSAAVEYADMKGAVVIASAGNGGTARLSYPAADRGVIAVGATNWRDEVVDFSQRGAHVALSAPGAGVLGARARGDQAVTNGTSFSSPIVAGVAALMLSVRPTLTSLQVRRIVEGTAGDIGPAGFDPAAGWGRVNAARAVAAARDGDLLPNRNSTILGRVTGADPSQVVIDVEPFNEVVRPAADGSFRLTERGRTTYVLRTTSRSGGYRGPISVTTSGEASDMPSVVIDFGS